MSELYDDAQLLSRGADASAASDPNTDAASAALDTLFSSAAQGNYNLEIAIDPSLSASAPAGSTENDQDQSPSNSGAPPPSAPAKAKGTSRANMLARGGACEFCKRRKLRCSAEVPSCASCRRTGRDCVYSQKKQRSRVRVLEDKLADLERRLEKGPNGASSGPTSVESSTAAGSATLPQHFISPDSVHTSTPPTGVDLFPLGLDSGPLSIQDLGFAATSGKREEPDLMTLADAAAADTEGDPFQGLDPSTVATELIRAIIENQKGGWGEKIMGHLIQLYSQPPPLRVMHWLMPPATFFARVNGHSPSPPPHPAFIAAIVPPLLTISPSPVLSSRATVLAVTDALMPPSRALAQHALTNLDPRLLDLVAAAALRSVILAMTGRFVDSWNENATCVSLAWAAGLGKLGGVAEAFVPSDSRPADRAQRVNREKRLRHVRLKGQITAPARNAQDVAERIQLFWCVYLVDKSNAVGWNWPSAIIDDEITTPLPQTSYDTVTALCDNTTLEDFLSGRVVGGEDDGPLCRQVKYISLAHAASRQLDTPVSVATPARTAHLLRITKRYMATLRPFQPPSREDAIADTVKNETWMGLHITLLMLYIHQEIDALSEDEETEARDKAIEAGLKMCSCFDAAFAAGDTELARYDLIALFLWYITGRAFLSFSDQLRASDPKRAADLRAKIDLVVVATHKMSKRLKLAEVHELQLQNVILGNETMIGEWQRPDNLDI
ncbi:hypothetical protein Q8F55_009033 [Vanrija albida]|uniref:Zn(2)-C6 fungal-type domain-containing protein n=1 Tax=Vanrija albida TaxID=181172 RepID=A0ABR3PSH8_9TREE